MIMETDDSCNQVESSLILTIKQHQDQQLIMLLEEQMLHAISFKGKRKLI